jgi:hypothetical protein
VLLLWLALSSCLCSTNRSCSWRPRCCCCCCGIPCILPLLERLQHRHLRPLLLQHCIG